MYIYIITHGSISRKVTWRRSFLIEMLGMPLSQRDDSIIREEKTSGVISEHITKSPDDPDLELCSSFPGDFFSQIICFLYVIGWIGRPDWRSELN